LAPFLSERLGVDDLLVEDVFRFADGFSWETWRITCSWHGGQERRQFIVRRVPECGLLDWYDVDVEWRLLTAVRGRGAVPTAEPLWLDRDGAATGKPMMLVEHVAGVVPTPWNFPQHFPDLEVRQGLVRELARIGARIHALPLDSVPADLRGAAADPAAEVDYWNQTYLRDRTVPVPVLDLAFAWLRRWRDAVSQQRTLVHGDFRVGNFIVADGRIRAMLDWEGAHVGDAVEDLANCCMRLMGGGATSVGGVLTVEEFLRTYEEESGRAVSREAFQYWLVFGSTRSAVTFLTAARRFREGRTDDVRFAALSQQIPILLRHILKDLTGPRHAQ
jgi:aminoglycoside phosphotransferase (APT) family kinase protein